MDNFQHNIRVMTQPSSRNVRVQNSRNYPRQSLRSVTREARSPLSVRVAHCSGHGSLCSFVLRKGFNKKRSRILIEVCKWMGEEFREQTQRYAACPQSWGFKANTDLCLRAQFWAWRMLNTKHLKSTRLQVSGIVCLSYLRDWRKFFLTILASMLIHSVIDTY